MNAQSVSFNLVDDPWIMVARSDGAAEEVSLRDLFARAQEFRTVSGEIPLEYIVTLRLALAVLYSAYGGIADDSTTSEDLVEAWHYLFERGAFDMDVIGSYLDDVHARFELFGREPFYQTSGLTYVAKGPDPVSELVVDMPKPDKFLFSMRSNREKLELSFAEAARCLLLNQAYDQAGIKSPVKGFSAVRSGKAYPPKGMLGTGWCGALGGIFLEGENLFETIMRNWVLVLNGKVLLGMPDDFAPWEREGPGSDAVVREPTGPVDLLSWQSRRIRLVLNEEATAVTGVVLCYGDSTRAADKFDSEIMTGWRASEAQQKKLQTSHVPLMPIGPDPSRALWRGLPSLLGTASGERSAHGDLRAGVIKWAETLDVGQGGATEGHRFVRVRSQGVSYGTQSSVIADMVDDYVDLDRSMLHADAETVGLAIEVVSQADAAVQALVQFVRNVQVANGADKPAVSEDVRERAYDELDGVFRMRLAEFGLDEDPTSYCNGWRDEIRFVVERIARDVVSSEGLSSFRESGSMTVGRALFLFKTRVASVLAHIGEDDDLSVDELGLGKES